MLVMRKGSVIEV